MGQINILVVPPVDDDKHALVRRRRGVLVEQGETFGAHDCLIILGARIALGDGKNPTGGIHQHFVRQRRDLLIPGVQYRVRSGHAAPMNMDHFCGPHSAGEPYSTVLLHDLSKVLALGQLDIVEAIDSSRHLQHPQYLQLHGNTGPFRAIGGACCEPRRESVAPAYVVLQHQKIFVPYPKTFPELDHVVVGGQNPHYSLGIKYVLYVVQHLPPRRIVVDGPFLDPPRRLFLVDLSTKHTASPMSLIPPTSISSIATIK